MIIIINGSPLVTRPAPEFDGKDAKFLLRFKELVETAPVTRLSAVPTGDRP